MSITITKNKMHLLKFHLLSSVHTFLWRTGCWVSSLEGPTLLGLGVLLKAVDGASQNGNYFVPQCKENLPSLVHSLNTS